MPSEHPFDSKLKQQFEQFQPEVEGDWSALEQRLNASSAPDARLDVPALNRWAVATAVAAGSALMWVAKPAVDALVEDAPSESAAVDVDDENANAPALSFDDAWEAYATTVPQGDWVGNDHSESVVDATITSQKPRRFPLTSKLLTNLRMPMRRLNLSPLKQWKSLLMQTKR